MLKIKLPTLYIIGMLTLILGFGLIVFALYVTPNLLFGINYPVPIFIAHASTYLQNHHDLDGYLLIATILLPIYFVGALFLFLSRQITVRLDTKECAIDVDALNAENELLAKKEEVISTRLPREKKYKINPVMLYLFYILLALSLLFFIEWLITFDYGAIT